MTWRDFVQSVEKKIVDEGGDLQKPITIVYIDVATDLGDEFRVRFRRDAKQEQVMSIQSC